MQLRELRNLWPETAVGCERTGNAGLDTPG
jgi:hypothetical protein